MSTIAIAGGTGRLGGAVVTQLADRGHHARIVSRHPRPAGDPGTHPWATVDYSSRAGLADAFDGVDAIVLATGALRDAPAVRAVAHAAPAGTPLVYISIVGIDDVPMPYYRQKLLGERAVIDSGLPWTILRATQFHTLAASMLGALAKPPVMLVPKGVTAQPVSHVEVAARLADAATAEPAGRLPDMGGPEVAPLEEFARMYLDATGLSRRVVPVTLPGRMMAALTAGALTTPDHRDGHQTFGEFLAAGGTG